MNKKWIQILTTFFLCATLAFGFTACNGEKNNSSTLGSVHTEQSVSDSSGDDFEDNSGNSSSEQTHTHNYTAITTAPTCTAQGFTTYSCACGDDYIADYVNVLEHDFHSYVSNDDATCTENGTETATCSRNGCNATDTRTQENSLLNHDYGAATYTWNENQCTAKRVCINDNTHVESETVIAKYVKDTDATCTTKETGHYQATFENIAFIEQNTADNSVINDGGFNNNHNYSLPVYIWNGNQCKASRVCLNDNAHVESETVTAKYVKDTDATCMRKETGHYQATFENSVFGVLETAQSTVENGNQLNHSFTNYVSDKNATYDEDGTKTAVCDYACGETDIKPELGSKLKDNKISFTTLSVGGWMGLTVSGKVSNATAQFSFENEISVSGSAKYAVYKDNDRSSPIQNKTVNLTIGDNTFYVVETVEGYYEKGYTVIIRRRAMCTVVYTGYNDERIATQIVEEDSTVSMPEQVPTRTGYTFDGWDYEFSAPITDNERILAKWSANTNTPYKIEYYLQNLGNDDYTLETTENKVGTTDETVYAEIKSFPHFTFQISYNDTISADGSTVLKAYYTRNYYTVMFDGNGGTAFDGNDTLQYVKYQDTAIAPSFIKNGYDFDGWNADLTNISENITVTAKWKIARYTITYDLNNGTLAEGNNPTTYTVESEEIALASPRLKNHGFLGWSDGEKYISKIPVGSYGDLTLTAMWEYAFAITENTLNSINKSAKTTCYEMEVPDTVTEIAENAFTDCRVLTNVTIQNSVKQIGANAFSSCGALNKVNYLGNIDEWVNIWFVNGYANPLSNGAGLYINDVLQTDVTIQTATVYAYAFVYYSALTNVSFGENVKVIQRGAFYGCDSLENITMGESVLSIGDFAFYSCEKLKQTDVSNTLLSLGEQAFGYCKSLKTLTIPKTVGEIGRAPFANCSALEEIIVEEGSSWLASIDGNLFLKDLNDGTPLVLLQYAMGNSQSAYVVPDSVFEIGDMAFMGAKNLERIEMSNAVSTIGEKCFYDCQQLQEITISNDVVDLLDGTFAYCEQLENVHGGENLESIGAEAFIGCSSLNDLGFLSNVKHIDSFAFAYCSAIEEFEILESVETFYWDALYGCDNLSTLIVSNCLLYCYDDSGLYGKEGKVLLFLGGANIENLIIKEGFTSIDCIRGGENIKNISLPNSLKIIEDYALNGLSNLQSINLENVTEIDEGAFSGCSSLATVDLANVTSIGANTFAGCTSLNTVDLANVTSIGANAFAGCASLKTVDLTNATKIGSQAFAGCTSLENVVFGSDSIELGDQIFYHCTSLKELTLPSTVQKVGERLFEGACVEKLNIGLTTVPSFMIVYIESIGEIELLDTVRTIETHAFYGIANGKLFLNDNVTDIDDYAFNGCEEVEKNVYNGCKFLGSKQNPYMVLMEVLDKSITHFETEDTTKFIYTNSFDRCFNLYSIVLNENVIHVSSWVFNDCKKLVEVYNLSNLDIRQDSYDNGCVGTWAFDIYDSKDAESKIFDENGFKVYHRDGYGYDLLSYEGTDKVITLTYSDLVSNAFRGNDVIEEVIMRQYWGITIQEGAFMGCINLKTVRICNCMAYIEAFAFAYCSNLTNIIYDGTIAEWKSIRKAAGWSEGLKATYVQCTDGLFSITAENENIGSM